MVLYKNGATIKYQLMTEAEMARMLVDPNVQIMDAFVYMLYDSGVLSSEDLIFRKDEAVGGAHEDL